MITEKEKAMVPGTVQAFPHPSLAFSFSVKNWTLRRSSAVRNEIITSNYFITLLAFFFLL